MRENLDGCTDEIQRVAVTHRYGKQTRTFLPMRALERRAVFGKAARVAQVVATIEADHDDTGRERKPEPLEHLDVLVHADARHAQVVDRKPRARLQHSGPGAARGHGRAPGEGVADRHDVRARALGNRRRIAESARVVGEPFESAYDAVLGIGLLKDLGTRSDEAEFGASIPALCRRKAAPRQLERQAEPVGDPAAEGAIEVEQNLAADRSRASAQEALRDGEDEHDRENREEQRRDGPAQHGREIARQVRKSHRRRPQSGGRSPPLDARNRMIYRAV